MVSQESDRKLPDADVMMQDGRLTEVKLIK